MPLRCARVCRLDDKSCEGFGIMFCGMPAISVVGNLKVTMSNTKNAKKSNSLSLTVRGGGTHCTGLYCTALAARLSQQPAW